MQNISFDSGFKTYILNGDESCKIRINVSDLNFLSRYEEQQKRLDELTEELKRSEGSEGERLAEFDRRFRECINGVFGSDVCTAAFGTANCLSPVESGKLLFQSFLDALMPVIEEDMSAQLAAAKSRADEYIGRVTD